MLRATQGMMTTQMMSNLNKNMLRMGELQNQLSTGRRINKPSDDAVGISFSMRYHSELSANDQYQTNIDAAQSWLSYSDTVLDQAGTVLQRVREMAVKAANGTNDETALASIKVEIKEMYDQMVSLGNSEFNGKYVFNGQMTDVKPYDLAIASTQSVDTGEIFFEIGAGVRIPVNVTADRIFGGPIDAADPHASDNIFNIMQEMMTALNYTQQSPPPDVVLPPGVTPAPTLTQLIGKMDLRMNKFLDIRSEIGAKTNRIDLADARMKDVGLNLTSLLSKVEDADMALVITNLKMNESVYQASLATGSKLIQPSLMDFLR